MVHKSFFFTQNHTAITFSERLLLSSYRKERIDLGRIAYGIVTVKISCWTVCNSIRYVNTTSYVFYAASVSQRIVRLLLDRLYCADFS